MKFSETEFGSTHTQTVRDESRTARIIRHAKVVPDPLAELAFSIAIGLAPIRAHDDAKRFAARACQLAEAMFAECGARGWLLPLPEYESLIERPPQD